MPNPHGRTGPVLKGYIGCRFNNVSSIQGAALATALSGELPQQFLNINLIFVLSETIYYLINIILLFREVVLKFKKWIKFMNGEFSETSLRMNQ